MFMLTLGMVLYVAKTLLNINIVEDIFKCGLCQKKPLFIVSSENQ